MHKNNVPGVARVPFNFMGETHYPSKDTVAWYATALTYGKYLITEFYTISIGSSYGLMKAAQLSCFVSYPVIVNSKSPGSRTIGSNKLQKKNWTTLKLNTLFMMPLIFTRTAA
jgi:hypothetical protein